MKKFTSLFALLAGLCVYNAQAEDVTIWVYADDPTIQHLYWWGADNVPTDYDASPTFNSLGEGIDEQHSINGLSIYKKTLKNVQNNYGIKFWHYGDNNSKVESYDINQEFLGTGSEFYFYYFGGDKDNYLNMSLTGNFNGWSRSTCKLVAQEEWSYVLDLHELNQLENIEFKIRANEGWLGANNLSISYPSAWSEYVSGSDNIVINHKSLPTDIKKILISIRKDEWNNHEWALSIGPAAEYTIGDNTYTVDGPVNIDLTGDPSFSATGSFDRVSAKYQRTINGNWGTLCLPFGINPFNEHYQDKVTFYQLEEVENNVMHFSPMGSVEAGTPCVFKLTGTNKLSIEEENTSLDPKLDNPDPEEYNIDNNMWEMFGTYETIVKNSIYYIKGDAFWYGTETSQITINPYRAYILGPAPTNAGAPLRIEANDTEGLQFVEQEDGSVKVYYDLQGRKLDSAHKGLVIENGKIIMVK